MTTNTLDIDQLIEEAKHGILSIPLSQLPPSVRALLMPALAEGQYRVIAEEREVILHRREIQHSERAKDWLETKSPEYQKAYEELFDTVANSESRLDRALFDLNESERQLSDRLADVERRAVHLPHGRLAFYENGHFVYEDGSRVGPDGLATCERAKKEADKNRDPMPSRQEYLALKNALTSTLEAEQEISGVCEEVQHTADQVRSDPPGAKSDLENDSAVIKAQTDNAVAQAQAQIAANKSLAAGQFRIDNPNEIRAATGLTSASFNTSATSKTSVLPKPTVLDLDHVTAAAINGP